jgi:hypothetical protein
MTRKLRQKLKQNRPPFLSLTREDVRLISDAGHLNCADDDGFYNQLDDLGFYYLTWCLLRNMGITDRQFRVKIRDALKHIARLNAFISNEAVDLTAHLLLLCYNPTETGGVPDSDDPDKIWILGKQHEAVSYLEHSLKLTNDAFEQCAARYPNNFTCPSATVLGLDRLVVGLALIWRNWSNGTEICTDGRHSRWIPFLRQSLNTIAQRDITEPAARKLTRRLLLDGNSKPLPNETLASLLPLSELESIIARPPGASA